VAKTAESLLEEALTLPAQDRAMVASSLLASLDTDGTDEAEVDRLWSAEPSVERSSSKPAAANS
jgi:hypothetical protein